MKSVVAAVLVLLPLVPACSKPVASAVAIASLRPTMALPAASAVSGEPVAPVVIDVASARPTMNASHASDITRLAVTGSGSAALTLDANGGVRLWPSLRGDREPVIVQFNAPTEITLGERADFLVAAAIDGSGGMQVQVLSKLGGLVVSETIRSESDFIDVVFVAGRGLLALSADQQLHWIDATGRITQTFTMPPGIRAERLCHAAGVVVALARMAGQPLALTLTGIATTPVWSRPMELPGTSIFAAVSLDASGKRLAVAVGAGVPGPLTPPPIAPPISLTKAQLKPVMPSPPASPVPAPPPVQPASTLPAIVGPNKDQIAFYDVATRTLLGHVELPTNAFTVNARFRPTVAFISKDRVYYRGATSGQLDAPASKPTAVTAAAVDPWVVDSPPEIEDNRAPSAAATAAEGVLVVAHRKHLRIETAGVAKFLGYDYTQLTPFEMQGQTLLAWGATQRNMLSVHVASAQVRASKLTELSRGVAYDERHRIDLLQFNKRDSPSLRIFATLDDEPIIIVPNISKDASEVQFGQRSSLLAVHNNNGDVLMAVYDRVHNTVSKPVTFKGYASIFMLDPALTGGIAAYSAKNDNTSSEMVVAAVRIEAGAVKVDSTFRVPGSIFVVDPAGQMYVAQNTAKPNQMPGFDVYHKTVKVRELTLPGVPQLSPDGQRLAVLDGERLSVYDTVGQRLWLQPAARGSLVWAADGQQLFVAADGGLMTFNATTGATVTRCGWNFGLRDDVPKDEGQAVSRSICERAW